MRLTVVGCSGSFPGPASPASCYLVEEEAEGRTWRILLDLGSGALGGLQRHADPLSIDAVFLSHLHADHCLDMCGFYVLRKYHPRFQDGNGLPRVPVWGPSDTAGRLARGYDLDPDPGMTGEFDFHDLGEAPPRSPLRVGPFTVTAAAVCHPVPAYALRVSAGDRALVYTGDSGPCPALEELAADADLLLAEASFLDGDDNPPNLHLTGSDAGAVAARGGVARLVVTHVPPWHDGALVLEESRVTYDGPCQLAEPGAVYDI